MGRLSTVGGWGGSPSDQDYRGGGGRGTLHRPLRGVGAAGGWCCWDSSRVRRGEGVGAISEALRGVGQWPVGGATEVPA